MKRLPLILIFLLALSQRGWSQTFTFPTTATAQGLLTSTAVATGNTVQLIGSDIHYHTLTWYASGTVTICGAVLQQSTNGTVWTTLIAQQTCTTTGETTTSTAGDVNYVRIQLPVKSGTGSVTLVYKGWVQNPYGSVGGGTSGLVVTTAICSGTTCYTSPVAGSAVAVGTATNTLFASTFGLQTLYVNNANAATVNVTFTDGNNAYIIGPTFGIPAFSNYALPPGLIGLILTNGLKASASAASSITVWFGGKQ